MDTAADISQVTDAARAAARVLANATTQVKNRGLEAIAAALIDRSDQILAANAEDVARGRAEQMSEGLLDRLALTPDRIRGIAEAVREIAGLPDPIGQVVRGMRTDIGLRVTQERVPLGVIGIIYEARPNVTIDAASLALKAGNAVVLRGGSAAQSSNRVLIEVCRDALTSVGPARRCDYHGGSVGPRGCPSDDACAWRDRCADSARGSGAHQCCRRRVSGSSY